MAGYYPVHHDRTVISDTGISTISVSRLGRCCDPWGRNLNVKTENEVCMLGMRL